MHTASPEMILINTDVWNSLSADEKKIIKDGALEGARVERAEWIRMERESEAKARAAGSVITTLTPAEQKAFSDALASMYEQPAYTGFRNIVQRIRNTQ
jgi:TRAP-type C4-dicarboxylate transport system substrate-binding protein